MSQHSERGPRVEQQDVCRVSTASDDSHYCGVFDGHGHDGKQIAALSSLIVPELSNAVFEYSTSAKERAETAADRVREKSKMLGRLALEGGSTATIAIVKENDLAVAYVGDSLAYYYPDLGGAVDLVYPHTVQSFKEVKRVYKSGGEVIGNYFSSKAGRIMVSRALGDWNYGFISADAEVTDISLKGDMSPGTLVLASDGLWGDDPENVEERVRQHKFNSLYVKQRADKNKDNATAIVVRIEK